jgi:hypothetical protein
MKPLTRALPFLAWGRKRISDRHPCERVRPIAFIPAAAMFFGLIFVLRSPGSATEDFEMAR